MILTWYLFKQTLKYVLISTCSFLGIIWLSQSFKSIKLIIDKGADLSDFFILSAYSFPSWLLIAIPFGIFAGCMISYFKLQNDQELLVMKAAGISPLKLSKPAFLVAMLASILLFIISHIIMPKTYKHFKILQNEIRNSTANFMLKDNIFIDISENQTIFIGKIQDNLLNEIFIKDSTDASSIVEFFAKEGYLTFDDNIILNMIDGTRISTDLKGKSTIINFEKYNIEIKEERNKSKTDPRVVEYNEYYFFELIKKSKDISKNQGKLIAEAHSRNTIIFMPFVFSFIVMVTVLNEHFSRKFSLYKKVIGIALLFIIQSIVLIIKNAVHTNIFLLPLMYAFPLLIFVACIIFLVKNNSYKYIFSQKGL